MYYIYYASQNRYFITCIITHNIIRYTSIMTIIHSHNCYTQTDVTFPRHHILIPQWRPTGFVAVCYVRAAVDCMTCTHLLWWHQFFPPLHLQLHCL